MPYQNTARNDENSVVVALQGLMGLEDERQQAEEDERLRCEKESRRLAEAAEQQRIADEERRRQEEEQQRLAEEQARRDEEERKAREVREQEIRIRAEAETRARIEEQQRMLEFELEMKQLSNRRRGIPAWTIGAAAALFLVVFGVGVALHLSTTSGYEARIADLNATLAKTTNTAAADAGAAQARLSEVTGRAVAAERRVNELTGKVATLEDEVLKLKTAKPGKRPRFVAKPSHGASKNPGADKPVDHSIPTDPMKPVNID
jgi:hypothetical protein